MFLYRQILHNLVLQARFLGADQFNLISIVKTHSLLKKKYISGFSKTSFHILIMNNFEIECIELFDLNPKVIFNYLLNLFVRSR